MKSNSTKLFSKRDSEFELLRVLAMFLVILFHGNFLNLYLDYSNCEQISTLTYWGYTFSKCVTICCVDIFILISGWYGIKLKWGKIINIYLKVSIISALIYLLCCSCFENCIFSLNLFIHYICGDGYWFIPSYIFLMLFSPFLNSYIDQHSKNEFRILLIVLVTFSFWIGWRNRAPYFDYGCSPLLFIVLYLIGRYLKLYQPKKIFKYSNKFLLIFFILLSIIYTSLSVFTCRFEIIQKVLLCYLSPFCILESIILVIIFGKIHFHSKLINILGISSLIVYIVHAQPAFHDYIFIPVCQKLFIIDNGLMSYFILILWAIFLYVAISMIWYMCLYVYHKAKLYNSYKLLNKTKNKL